MKDRFLKRLRKKAKKGMRGWPAATIAFYGPDANRASKVVVGIVASEHAEVGEIRDWKLDAGEVRNDPPHCRGDAGVHGESRRAVRRHDRPHHRLPASGKHRLPG
jgi:hypothetical protein